MKTKTSILLAIALFGLFLSLALLVTSHHDPRPTKEEQTAMSVLPGYLVVFDGETNTISHSDNVQTFRNQHPMMDYLTVLAPYVKQYDHPKNHPIMIQETGDHVILELPSRVRFPPYNWKIYWGSPYYLKMEIDKKTKQIVDAVQG